ncbi:MAG: TIGR01777 family oxidoreductase [Candidatus Hydrogenedens sp.]
MKILLSGASGFVGKHLYNHLCEEGFTCYKLVRTTPCTEKEIFWDPYKEIINQEAIKDIDIFIHLSGANIADAFWTKKRKQVLMESRVQTTKFLAESIARLNNNSKRLFISSAIGYYGVSNNTLITESGEKGQGFLSTLCENWEHSAQIAISSGVKTVFMRFGIVMGKDGGYLNRLMKIYRLGLGGVVGDKNASLSWIAIEDLCSAIIFLLKQEKSQGPYNFVSPNPVTQKEFSSLLSKIVKRPAFFHIPSCFIKAFLGEMGRELFLADQKVYPEKLLNEGFIFTFPYFAEYLEYLFR